MLPIKEDVAGVGHLRETIDSSHDLIVAFVPYAVSITAGFILRISDTMVSIAGDTRIIVIASSITTRVVGSCN